MTEPSIALLRCRLHQVLDPLWMEALENGGYREKKKAFLRSNGTRQLQKIARERVYGWLAEKMWLSRADCHAARFDAEQCQEAILLLENVTYIEIRRWARVRKRRDQKAVGEARPC